MKKLSVNQIKDLTLIDIRDQDDFQQGHVADSLNLKPGNLGKYGQTLLEPGEEIALVVHSEADLKNIDSNSFNIQGFIEIDDFTDQDLQATPTVSVQEFLADEADYILLDVRHPDEITRPAPEKNLVNIPLEYLSKNLDQLDQNKKIYTLCGSGNRSTSAASLLQKNHYQPAVIQGGMKAVQDYQQ